VTAPDRRSSESTNDELLAAGGSEAAADVGLLQVEEREVTGLRAGGIVLVGIAAANIGNYLFHLISARVLGPSLYGDVASLSALTGLITLPLVGVQLAVARYVAGFNELGEQAAIHVMYRRGLAIGLVAGACLTVLLTALAVPMQRILEISSLSAVVITTLVALPTILVPIVSGLAQGLQRFWVFAFGIGAGPMIRALLAAVFLGIGLGVSGAMAATTLSTVLAVLVPFVVLRQWLQKKPRSSLTTSSREVLAYLVPVLVGVLAITSLSTIDVLFAKGLFASHTAGVYGGASLVGRVILYSAFAIVFVLLPKVSARAAAGQDALDVLGRSVLVTVALCLVGITLYAAVPKLLLDIAFGSSYEAAASYLWLFAVAMSGYAVLNVLLAYHLGRGDGRFSWILLVGATVQIGLFAAFHDSPRQLLAVDIVIAGSLVAAHELVVDPTFRRLLRARRASRTGETEPD
jgi:O-antigen/teichoic acid export membrane protein